MKPNVEQEALQEGREGREHPAGGAQHGVPGRAEPRRLGRRLHRRAVRLHGELHLHRRLVAVRRHRAPLRRPASAKEVTMQVDTTTIGVVGTVREDDLRRGRARQRLGADQDRPGGRGRVGRQPGDAGHRRPAGRLHGLRPDAGLPLRPRLRRRASARARSRAASRRTVYDDGYGWTGAGAPGDSGSGVLTAPGGPAIGDFTHLIVDLGAYPGSDLAGTRITQDPEPVRRRRWSTPTARPRAPPPPAAATPRASPHPGQTLRTELERRPARGSPGSGRAPRA